MTKKPDNNGGDNNTGDKLYYVQAGAFKDKNNAEKLKEKLNKEGFDAIIK